jgi:hypothetical protein
MVQASRDAGGQAIFISGRPRAGAPEATVDAWHEAGRESGTDESERRNSHSGWGAHHHQPLVSPKNLLGSIGKPEDPMDPDARDAGGTRCGLPT